MDKHHSGIKIVKLKVKMLPILDHSDTHCIKKVINEDDVCVVV